MIRFDRNHCPGSTGTSVQVPPESLSSFDRNRCPAWAGIRNWERSGFVLWLKKLEKDRFAWPCAGEHEAVVTLEPAQLNLLLDGYDVWRMRPHQRLFYEVA